MRKTATVFSLLGVALPAVIALQSQDLAQDGPTAMVIQYRCNPSSRAAFRQAMEGSGVGAFEALKSNQVLSDYHLLFSRYADTNNWDMLAILQFRDYANVAKWAGVERRTPAGLNPDAMQHVLTVSSYPVDAMRVQLPDSAVDHPVYLVIPYTLGVSVPQYLQFADSYMVPQFAGWANAGVLAGYTIFCQRYPAARPWDSLVVLEYKDHQTFGQREKVMGQVRQSLEANPSWKALADNPQHICVEKEAVIADELHPVR